MIRTTLALAAAGLFLVACDAKTAPEGTKLAEPAAPAAPAGPNADADKAMADMAAAMSAAGAGGANAQIANPQMKTFVEGYEKVADIILTVKDQASAKIAAEKLRPLLPEIEKQGKAIEALAENEKMTASMQAAGRLASSALKIAQHMSTLPPDVQQSLGAELEKLPQPN